MSQTVVVAGVGPGLGESISRRFASEGCSVALLARGESYLDELADDLDAGPGAGLAVPTDLRDVEAVRTAFADVREAFGPVDVLVAHASGSVWKGALDLSVEEFQSAWEVAARGGFVAAQEAASDMVESDGEPDAGDGRDAGDGGGTIIFTGATSSIRGRDGALDFSSAKFAVRGMAESMARELGPRGVHVAHVVIDGGIRPPHRTVEDPEQYLDPDAIADTYWHLTQQDRSAWTLELDVRPHVENF